MNKEKIALLVDSGTDVPEALVKQYGMYVLPLQIIYPEKTYTDKVDICLLYTSDAADEL